MSASRRRARLRIDTFEDRVVPTLGLGVNVDSYGTTGVAPDGNSGAVGPGDFVQITAGGFQVYDKAGNNLVGEADTQFWTDAGISASLFGAGLSEPRVVYDALTDRWFAMELTLNQTANEVLVARSDTGDPTGHWSAVHYTGAAGLFSNFPTLGVDANGVYVGTANLNATIFAVLPGGVSLTAIPKADLLAATPTAANRTTFTQPDSNDTMGWAPQVVTNFDPNPAQATVIATGYYSTEFNQIVVTPLTWSGGVPTLGASQHIATNLHTSLPGSSRQPNGTRILSAGEDDRYTGAIYQVGDLIYAAHTISVTATGTPATSGTNTHNAIHVVVLRASTNAIVAEKIYFNSSFDYSFASVAANANGDIVMGLNRSGTSTTSGQAGAYVVHGRLDLSNPSVTQRITFDQEVQVMAGTADGFDLGDGPPEGWGPYGATVVDPTNPKVFWTTQEYAVSNDTWGTRVASLSTIPQSLNVSTTTANGTYGVGAVIPITVAFSDAVTVTGTPKLNLNSAGSAVYTGGSGTSTLTFTYTVTAGQTTSGNRLDYASTTPFDLTGATIDGDGGVPANLTLPAPGTAGSLSGSFNIVIDTSGSQVTGVTSPLADGTYGFGQVVPVTVTFNHPVSVTGTPQLALNTGGTASYASGTGTNTLTFTYTVAAGQSAADLDYTSAAALTLNGGSITDLTLGGPAGLTLPAPGSASSLGANKNIVIDAVAATITTVTSPTADGTYGVGAVINVTVQFTKAVTVMGTPKLALSSGGTASYASGSGTSTLTFTYTVAAGDSAGDLDEASAAALTLNGGSIQAAGLSANLSLPAPGASGSLGFNKNIAIDTSATAVADVTSPTADGSYATGAVIDVTVRFTKPVTVTGTPQLALNSGGTASYLSGSGTDTLTFRYTVAAGQNAADLDYASTTALTLNGGSIQSGGVAANLTLPAPGAAGSVGANKNITVDAVGPTVVDYRVLYGTKWYSLSGSTRFDLPWLITGVQVVFSEPVMTGNLHSLAGLTSLRFTGLRTTTLTWKFRGVGLGSFNTTLASSGANALKDRAGNPILPFGQSFKVLWGDVNDDGFVNALDEAAVRAAQAGPYQAGTSGYNVFADLSGDGIVNLVDVGTVRTRKGTHL